MHSVRTGRDVRYRAILYTPLKTFTIEKKEPPGAEWLRAWAWTRTHASCWVAELFPLYHPHLTPSSWEREVPWGCTSTPELWEVKMETKREDARASGGDIWVPSTPALPCMAWHAEGLPQLCSFWCTAFILHAIGSFRWMFHNSITHISRKIICKTVSHIRGGLALVEHFGNWFP